MDRKIETSDINSISAYHISSSLDAYESARGNFFTFIVDDLDNLVKSDFALEEPAESDYLTGAQAAIKLAVSKASVPHFELGTIEIRRGNSVVKYAGNPTWPEGSIEVNDFVGLDVKSILMAWHGLAYNVITDRGGRAINYKKKCTLVEYTQDHQEIRHWDLYGCWISKLDEEGFDMEADSARKIACTIQYDRAIMHSAIK